MIRCRPLALLTALSLAAPLATAQAATLTVGAGSAVTTPDAVATFDAGTVSGLVHTEAGLTFSGGAGFLQSPFDAFGEQGSRGDILYAGGVPFITIAPVGTDKIGAIEFLYGDGFTSFGGARSPAPSNLVWAAFRDGSQVGGGVLDGQIGTVVGIADPDGFDQLRVNAGPGVTAFGAPGAIALDDVAVDFLPLNDATPAPIPLPAPALLLAGGLVILGGLRRRR